MAKTRISPKTTLKTSGSSATEYDMIRRPLIVLHMPSTFCGFALKECVCQVLAFNLILTSPPTRQGRYLSQADYGTDKTSNPTATSLKKPNMSSASMLQAVDFMFHSTSKMSLDSCCVPVMWLLIQILPYFRGLGLGVDRYRENTS
jgi:hypothetical protein